MVIYRSWFLKNCNSGIPRLSAKGIEADATISKLSTSIQPTLDIKTARAEGIDKTPSEAEGFFVWDEERKKEEMDIILYTLTNEKHGVYTTPPFKKYKANNSKQTMINN